MTLTATKPIPTLPAPIALATSLATPNGPSLLDKDFEYKNVALPPVNSGIWEMATDGANYYIETTSISNLGPSQLNGIEFGGPTWKDYIFGFQFKVTDCNPEQFFGCIIIVNFRNYEGQCYPIKINSNLGTVEIQFGGRNGWQNFSSGSTLTYIDLPKNNWHDFLLVANKDNLDVFIDGQWAISVIDNRLPTGSAAIQVGAATTAQFDNFFARRIPEY